MKKTKLFTAAVAMAMALGLAACSSSSESDSYTLSFEILFRIGAGHIASLHVSSRFV